MPNRESDNFSEIAGLRKEYQQATLDVEHLESDPIKQFQHWFNDAVQAQIIEPNAMALATVDSNNAPAVRYVLLKGFDQQGFKFFTNYGSAKSQHITANPSASLAFYWQKLERQVRIEGSIKRLDYAENQAYFATRPREAQLAACCSKQSQKVSSRAEIEQSYLGYQEKYSRQDSVPCPENWGGFLLQPNRFEFWQGRVGRLHDRFEYKKTSQMIWTIARMWP